LIAFLRNNTQTLNKIAVYKAWLAENPFRINDMPENIVRTKKKSEIKSRLVFIDIFGSPPYAKKRAMKVQFDESIIPQNYIVGNEKLVYNYQGGTDNEGV
jgi:hypothetical protein